jgi:UDP-3-O-[3-hydroxymyristoyl] glucosamine N-acyltransferase
MTQTLKTLCQTIGIEYLGSDYIIDGIEAINHASQSEISFFSDFKHLHELPTTNAKAVLISNEYVHHLPKDTIPLISSDPYHDMALLSKLFVKKLSSNPSKPRIDIDTNIDKSVYIGDMVEIGDRVTIMSGCHISDHVTIGDDTIIYSNVSIYRDTTIGAECIIHSGAVIGADGFGFVQSSDNTHTKIHHNGSVEIGDRVEIGANSSIDRATFGFTTIGEGTKIDNQVQIGHNCQVGRNCLIVSYVALGGSTILGDNVTMAGQSGTKGHLSIGSGATIVSRAGVTKSLDGGKWYGGFPAIEHKEWLKINAKLNRL